MKNLLKEKDSYLIDYVVLFFILIFGIIALSSLGFDRLHKIITILLMSLTYVIWGIAHHWLAGDLHIKVVLEYLLIAILSNVVIFALLFWV